MGRIYQLFASEQNTDPDAPGGTLNFRVDQTESDTAALALVSSGVPGTLDGTLTGPPLQKCMIVYKGGMVYDVTASYGPIQPLATGQTMWEVDTTGGKEKRYQALTNPDGTGGTRFITSSDAWLNAGGLGQIDFKGAIGQGSDGKVEGVEVNVPKLSLTAKRKYNSLVLPSNYVQQLYELTATINKALYLVTWQGQSLAFQPGELLFLGATITEATTNQLEIDHKFEASYDRLLNPPVGGHGPVFLEGFTEGGTGLQKYGWDYAWMAYFKQAGAAAVVETPQQYQSCQVYDQGDFTILIL